VGSQAMSGVSGFGNFANIAGDGKAAGAKQRTGGVLAGIETPVDEADCCSSPRSGYAAAPRNSMPTHPTTISQPHPSTVRGRSRMRTTAPVRRTLSGSVGYAYNQYDEAALRLFHAFSGPPT